MPPRYHCEQCDFWFNSLKQIRQHYLDVRPHPFCAKCKLGFADKEEKQDHYRNSDEHEYCHVCHRGFPAPSVLQKHYLEDDNHPVCCGLGFVDEEAKTAHFSDKGSRPHCTDITCRRPFPHKVALNQHLKDYHGQVFSAQNSSSTSAGSSAFYTPNSRAPIKCFHCDIEFASQIELDMHLRDKPRCRKENDSRKLRGAGGPSETANDSNRQYTCQDCKANFQCWAELKEHLQGNPSHYSQPRIIPVGSRQDPKDSSSGARRFKQTVSRQCWYCAASFAGWAELEQHFQDNPSHRKCTLGYQCFACQENFPDAGALKDHDFSSYHRSCTMCKIGFLNPTDLNVHFRESREHPTCRDCNTGFFDGETEEYHRQSNTKQARCTKCHQIFQSVCARLQHQCPASQNIRTECGACHDRFINREAFDHHLVGKSSCITCQVVFPSACAKNLHQCSGRGSLGTAEENTDASFPDLSAPGFAARLKAYILSDDNKAEGQKNVSTVVRTPKPKTPLAPRATNYSQPVKLNSPLVTPGGLNEYLKRLGNQNNGDDQKAETEEHSKENIRPQPQPSQKIECGACEAVFSTNSGMAAHMESGTCLDDDETGMYPHVLHFDKTRAFIVPNLITYLDGSITRVKVSNESHFDMLNMCYNCPYCKASFDSSEKLDLHLKGTTHEVKVYRCPGSDCGQRFSRMGDLLKHIEEDSTMCRMDFVRGDDGMAELKNFVNKVLRSNCS